MPPSHSYSMASAVWLNELLKGGISLGIAVSQIEKLHHTHPTGGHLVNGSIQVPTLPMSANYALGQWIFRFRRVGREVFSDDCWKLVVTGYWDSVVIYRFEC
ncbi:hypothetical protein JB92DRAFT_454568 [Gautieria morchelliformis]|nr:hypothetical protein JB92DRAFT_454568 [Gautieria morchelliformis]